MDVCFLWRLRYRDVSIYRHRVLILQIHTSALNVLIVNSPIYVSFIRALGS